MEPGCTASDVASKTWINQDKRLVTLVWPQRAVCVYLWASGPAEKGERGWGGARQGELVKLLQDQQAVVGWGFGVQRHHPVEREYMRSPILFDGSLRSSRKQVVK